MGSMNNSGEIQLAWDNTLRYKERENEFKMFAENMRYNLCQCVCEDKIEFG